MTSHSKVRLGKPRISTKVAKVRYGMVGGRYEMRMPAGVMGPKATCITYIGVRMYRGWVQVISFKRVLLKKAPQRKYISAV